ncbi:MAG: alpha/beta hydrolase [Methylobacter sp.]|uniref:alpha/beta hydrolase n=1 Tax=Methylobacter sp. TaxID=2051955 RepID=UPI002730F68F|nr:alpha/beta hydrolase [Methylobacter sp.]MDP1666018.1 alpha/beta hydrolase [Methylobacter sp.]
MPTFKPMLSILLTYLLLLLIVFLFQRKMIYFPDTYSIEDQQQLADQADLKLWPSADDYRGLVSNTSQPNNKGTVIVFHGNAGSATDRTYYLDALEKQGYRVILAEYPGYAARNGAPSEAALVSDGVQTAKQALNDFGEPVFLWGESIGGGVVSGIVQSGQVPVKGIVLITPFSSMADVAQHHYWFFLAKWLIRDNFDNIKNLQNYSGNAAILIAEADEIIPNKYSLKLFESLHHNKKLWTFKGAGHNTLPLNKELPWWQEVMQFVNGQNWVSP